MKKRKPKVHPDLEISAHGNISMIKPKTLTGQKWVKENLPDATYYADTIVCEWRYITDIISGARSDGLVIAGIFP